MQVIYIDMLFVLNLVMDYMIFWMSSKLLGHRILGRRIFIASCIGAFVYCLFIVIPWINEFPLFMLQLLVPILPILFLYRPKGIKVFVKTYVVATLVAAVVGGVSFNFYFMLGGKYHLSVWLPVSIGILLCTVLFLMMAWIKKRLIAPYFEYEVGVTQGKKHLILSGYLDTGNRLYTVKDQRPVMIANYSSIEEILTERQRQFLEVCDQQGIEKALEMVEGKKEERYYLIPFSSIGCKDGVVIGIQIDKMQVRRGNFEESIEGGIIAIHFGKLFNCDVYDILIHPDYVKS